MISLPKPYAAFEIPSAIRAICDFCNFIGRSLESTLRCTEMMQARCSNQNPSFSESSPVRVSTPTRSCIIFAGVLEKSESRI